MQHEWTLKILPIAKVPAEISSLHEVLLYLARYILLPVYSHSALFLLCIIVILHSPISPRSKLPVSAPSRTCPLSPKTELIHPLFLWQFSKAAMEYDIAMFGTRRTLPLDSDPRGQGLWFSHLCPGISLRACGTGTRQVLTEGICSVSSHSGMKKSLLFFVLNQFSLASWLTCSVGSLSIGDCHYLTPYLLRQESISWTFVHAFKIKALGQQQKQG